MAKTSVVQRNQKRRNLILADKIKRSDFKKIIYNKEISLEERFNAVLLLAKMRRNGSVVRFRNRCELTGRGRGVYKKFMLSRICFRDLASDGKLPGVMKASW